MDFGSAAGRSRSSGANISFGTPSRTKGGAKSIRDQRHQIRGRLLTGQEDRDYPSALQLYLHPPTMDISLEMFEELADQRLKVLRIVEKQNLTGKNKFSSEWSDAILKDLKDTKPSSLGHFIELAKRVQTGSKKIPPENYMANRQTDHVSHFLLRLAYCRTEDLRRWFITHETDLFRLRWGLLKENCPDELQFFMTASGLSYQPIDSQEKEKLSAELISSAGYGHGMTREKFNYEKFYKVPWTEAVDLVRARRVMVKGGMAYIPSHELLSLVVGVFRAKLSHNLVLTCRVLPVLEDDSRLVTMVQNLDKRYTGEDYGASKNTGRVMPQEVDGLSKKNFPLCMKSMQEVLTTSHHIKYKARLQYQLFLKGIGLTLDDALKFFRGEFTKRTDVNVDTFEKDYAYGIRYNYGKEGKKKNWQPYDCLRIIMENVGAGENHGCPFRHHETKTIRQRIESYDLKKDEADSILKKVKEGHFQIACSMHYSAVHLRELSTGSVSHPNQWYLESRGLGGGEDASNKSNKHIKTTKATVYNQDRLATHDSIHGESQEMMDDSVLL